MLYIVISNGRPLTYSTMNEAQTRVAMDVDLRDEELPYWVTKDETSKLYVSGLFAAVGTVFIVSNPHDEPTDWTKITA